MCTRFCLSVFACVFMLMCLCFFFLRGVWVSCVGVFEYVCLCRFVCVFVLVVVCLCVGVCVFVCVFERCVCFCVIV